MALMYVTSSPKEEDIGTLQTFGFVYNRQRDRWETRKVTRTHEARVREHLPHLTLVLSKPEQFMLQLNSPTAEMAPEQFWVASTIPERSVQLTTRYSATDPAGSIIAAQNEAAACLGCTAAAIVPAKYLTANIKED